MSNAKLFLAIVLPSIVAGCTDLELTIDHCGYDYSQNLFVLQGHAELTKRGLQQSGR